MDLTNLVEQLNYFYDHPLNLNTASKEDLFELMLLTDLQINALLLHRELFGKLISIYELQAVPYWDLQTIELVSPFVKVDDKLDQLHVGLKEALKQGKFELYLRYQSILEEKEGYKDVPDSILLSSNKYYYGDPNRYYTRFRYSYRTNLSFGVTAEKDPGESFFRGAQKNGFDFYSAHAYYKGGKYLKAIALGDYQVQIGQGINLWTGYAFGKTADVTNVKKTANPLRPYTSVDENRFLRGIAVLLGFKKFSLLSFASMKRLSVAITEDTLDAQNTFFESINLSGFHRTTSEINRKNQMKETLFGGNLKYETRNFEAAVSAVQLLYDKNYLKDTLPYNQFDFRGKNALTLSADYNWVFKNFNFFGEIARSSYSGGWGQIHGLLIALDARVSMSLVYRNYGRNYQTFYKAGFGNSSATQNEKGWFAGLKINWNRSMKTSIYSDLYQHPWLKFGKDFPSTENDFLIQHNYRPHRNFEIYARFRHRNRMRNSRDTDGTITELENELKNNYRFNFRYKIDDAFTLKSRVEYVTLYRPSNPSEDGVIFTQDVIYKPKSLPVSFALRYALFDTDSYDTRIYTYENNALYVFSTPAYYYRGSRAYALVRYKFWKKFDLWVRYGMSVYANRDTLGTGAEQINGNTRTDLTIQLRVKF